MADRRPDLLGGAAGGGPVVGEGVVEVAGGLGQRGLRVVIGGLLGFLGVGQRRAARRPGALAGTAQQSRDAGGSV